MKLLVALFIVFIFSGQIIQAQQNNTCWIQAPKMDDVWVIIYGQDIQGNRGEIIWQGKITAAEKVKINCKSGYIRYNYTEDPDQPYKGDATVECTENRVHLMQ